MMEVLAGIRAQTVPSLIWIWDNSYDLSSVWTAKGADVVIRSTHNFGCYSRFVFASLAQTEFVFTQDDDFSIVDSTLFEKLIACSRERPDNFIGVKGKNYGDFSDKEKPYQCGPGWVDSGPCMSVNTGLSFFRTELINRMPANPYSGPGMRMHEDELLYGDDMYVSAHMKCYAFPFMDHVRCLSEQGQGLSHRTPHMDVRNDLSKRYWLQE